MRFSGKQTADLERREEGAIYEKLRDRILPQLIPPNAKILIAVSGGPDSVALAHILWRYRQDAGKKVSLLLSHVHHGVRTEAEAEKTLVERLAAQWGIPCLIHRFDAKKQAEISGESFQTAARAWRYERWREDMKKEGCTLLATAHHLGDQAETVLYRLLRGSGAAGLAGIYPDKQGVIRPLLEFDKAELLAYCRREGLSYAMDVSNTEPVYMRNKIRLELLAELERDYNPQIRRALGRTAVLMRWDEDYFQEIVAAVWKNYQQREEDGSVSLKRAAWQESPALLSRLIRKAAAAVTQEPRGLEFLVVEKIMERGAVWDWKQDFRGFCVMGREDRIVFKRSGQGQNREDEVFSVGETPLKRNTWAALPDGRAEAGLFDADHCPVGGQEGWKAVLKAETALIDALVCRYRRPGDRMFFKGLGHKELKKVFQEAGVSAARRGKIPLIAVADEVVWIPGLKRGDFLYPEAGEESVVCLFRDIAKQ
ncbi:MAG: tRNA lysidine(34) synthetase TilS [Peptococcaceae bacterium]|nr:tRNA lysidine(34) synthetase TilS [Peptococcaceae bacterium]